MTIGVGVMKKSNQISLKELVLKRRTTLQSEFEHADTTNSGMVSIDAWADIMLKVTQIKVQWSVLVRMMSMIVVIMMMMEIVLILSLIHI